MTYYDTEDVKTPSIPKENENAPENVDPRRVERLRNLRLLLKKIGHPEIGSYGFKRAVAGIESHSEMLTDGVREIIVFRIQRILEDYIEQWLLSGDDQVYNVLDIVLGYDTVKSDILGKFDENWFRGNRDRFLLAARCGYDLAIKQNKFAVAEKIQILFPEFAQGIPH